MKKFLSIALTLALVLSLGVSAFADVEVNGRDPKAESVKEAQYVSADGETTEYIIWPIWPVEVPTKDELTVQGDVTGAKRGNADSINATSVDKWENSSSEITVEGNVTEYGWNDAIEASGKKTMVEVGGDVTEYNSGDAINASKGATVIVVGSVEESGLGKAINASGNNTSVKVGGNVTEIALVDVFPGVTASDGATIIVEGVVNSDIKASENGDIYLGKLNGDIVSDKKGIHYLIGTGEGSEEIGEKISIRGVTDKVTGATEKIYYGTINGEDVILKSNVNGKQLEIYELPEGVKYDQASGKLELPADFKGGLQNLKFVLVEIPGPAPVYYVVPVGTIKVVEFKAPDGIEEGLIKVLDSADHAGLTIDKSLLAEGYDHSVKVTLGEEELPEGAYRFVINWDGSLSVIMSSTYLLSLGDGSYDFVATVDDLTIPFTVVVAK